MIEEEKYNSEDDFFLEIKTVETLKESLDEQIKEEDSSKQISEELERDLSKVEPNRDQAIVSPVMNISSQYEGEKESIVKLSYELEKLKVIVLELTNYYPHYQPRTIEKKLLNLPFRNKKELNERDFDVFKAAVKGKQFGSDSANGGIENLNEILEICSTSATLHQKLTTVIQSVTDLSNKLIEYVDHLKRKIERSKKFEKKKEDDLKDETIGAKKIAICRRKNHFPIVGVSARDISPIRENFCIKEVISNVEDISNKKSTTEDEKNKPKGKESPRKKDKSQNHSFQPFVRDLIHAIDRLRRNMIIALKSNNNFVLKSDWEFFTNMFKKKALSWNSKDKLNHLENLVVEDYISDKMGDATWRFLETRSLTEDRIKRIRAYNKNLEKEFNIQHKM